MTTLGERIRERRDGWMTQSDLAAAADVSLSLIRKLEQGQRHTASIPSLQRIARALDMSVGDLLDKAAGVPSADPSVGVVAIRRALTPVDDLLDGDVPDEEPLTLDQAERTVTYLWGAYWAGRYELLSSLLPTALMQLRATVRAVPASERAEAARALARAYHAAGDTLVHLGHQDAAFLAIREALRAAEDSDDPLLACALRVSVSWQMLVQGRYGESERVALTTAQSIEPVGDVSESQLAAYGILTITAATAAARAGRPVAELLDVSRQAANRLGYERTDHQTTFGPAKLAMLAVDVHVVRDEFAAALTAAKELPRDAALPLASRARHMSDLALAQLRLGRDEKSLNVLLAMEGMAPEWIKYQSLPRQITRDLLAREQRKSTRLREFARRIGVVRTA